MLPDFLIIGAPRSGTSTLYEYLAGHPCIGRAFRKEVSFFDYHYDKGVDWYRSRFPTLKQKSRVEERRKVFLTGEASPNYLFYPPVPERVVATLPEIKLLAIFRNPIDRAYSAFQREARKGRDLRSFPEAVAAEISDPLCEWKKAAEQPGYLSPEFVQRSYLGRGLYAEQLQWWMKFFPRERFLIVRAESFFKKPLPVLNDACDFLGAPQWFDESFRNSVSGRMRSWIQRRYNYDYAPMETSVRNQLVEFFRPHNRRLGELLGTEFDWDK